MAVQYINSPEKDFSSGIDARSSENQIDPGFVKDLLNGDIVERRVRKRKGYQGFSGNIPIRVIEMDYENGTDQVCFTLDSAVDIDTALSLETVRSSPIVVYGRSSTFLEGQGPFTTSGDTAKYYPTFTVPLRKELTAPSGTLVIPGAEHGLGTFNLFVYVVESTSLNDRSYTKVLTDAIRIDETTFDVSIDYTTSVDRDVFVFFADKDAVTAEVFIATLSHGGAGSQTFTVTAATHDLVNYNIIPQIYQDTGTERLRVVPDDFVVAVNGDVSITINSSSATTYYAILSAAPVPNTVTGVLAASSTGTVLISNPDRPWVFFGIYLEQTPGGAKELVYPDSIDYSEVTDEFTFSFTNGAAVARNFIVYYEYGYIRSNQLCVTDSTVTVSGSDPRPQLSIWGLDHDEIYLDKVSREGWVNHIDSYRRSGEQRLVCGLGGNLFSARTYAEAASTYLYPTLYPRLFARASSNLVLAPLFWDTGETPARTRGYITTTNGGTHWATVSSVEYDSGNGWTKYTISVPAKSIVDSTGAPTSLASVISTTLNLEDWLTVESMSYARHNGDFKIKQILDGINSIQVWVLNSAVDSADYDDLNTGGQAGIFTDQVPTLTSSPFVAGDLLVSEALGDTFVCNVLSVSGLITVADGVVDLLPIPAGVIFNAQRSSAVIPLRNAIPDALPDSDNLVRGDMLSYSEIDRLLRVLYINADQDRTVNITESSGVATVTLLSGDTSYLVESRQILLLNAGVYTGVHTVSSVSSTTTFEFETEETGSVSGATLAGETMQIDETLTWQDTSTDLNTFRVESRWIPLEAPDDMFSQTPSTYTRYFDTDGYSDQSFLRSTMVVDNMYLTNGVDEVYKNDGTNIYRAGILPWQPGLFVTLETSGAAIVISNRSFAYSARVAAEGRLVIGAANQNSIPVGASVRLSGSTATYTISSYETDGTNYYVLMDRALDTSVSASGTVAEIATFRYYFRLNAVDANDNIIASAATGSQDHVVELTQNAAVQLKLVGLPSWDVYDYDRLELQIYRTKQGQAAPFYLITTIPMDFDNTQGYMNYRDSFADSDITQLDVVNTALKGSELGTGWSDPLRSKYITSIGNRLVQGNLRDYPQLDMQIVADANLANAAFAGDTLLFRKDNTDTATTTYMPDRAKYEWRLTSSAIAISALTPQAISFVDGDVNTGTDIITVVSHGLYTGMPVLLTTTGVLPTATPTGLSVGTTYFAISLTANTFQLAYTLLDAQNGNAIDITSAAGGGTHTLWRDAFEVTVPNTAANGDWVYLFYSTTATTARPLTFCGWFQIRVASAASLTIGLAGQSSSPVAFPDMALFATDPTDIPVPLGTDGNMGMVNGDSFDTFDSMRRMSMAINASQRMVDNTITGMDEFQPWLSARGGNDLTPAGRLIVRQPRSDNATFEVLTTFSGYDLFVNSVKRTTGDQISASTRVFPSRILMSYENYPEIFDNPTTILDVDSDSAIDINSADGQEITGVIPFFGEAAFGAAQQSGILVVFKTNSIYLVDINEKAQGRNAVQRIETEGLGCTAPYSIAVTKNGIMFANESGIYCLRRNQTIQYIGRYMERNWTEGVSIPNLDIAQGHHYGVGRVYKLSVPLSSDIDASTGYVENSEVFIYNHTSESEGKTGSWGRYDNHAATGWANLNSDAFFGSTGGRVLSIRNLGQISDFRDDNEGILFQLDTRPNDFGNSSIRKVVDKIMINYRTGARNIGTAVLYALDLEEEYSDTSAVIIPRGVSDTGMEDTVSQAVVTIGHNVSRRRCVYFNLRITNSTLDENLEIAGIDHRVGGLQDKGILQAAETEGR